MKLEKPEHVGKEQWRQHLIWMGIAIEETKENIEKYQKGEWKNGRRVNYK